MTKTLKKSVTDSGQLNLFDLFKQEQAERQESAPGRLCISAKLLSEIKKAVKHAPMSRETLADTMTSLSGRDVTVSMINNYCADSHPHHFPAELIPTLLPGQWLQRPAPGADRRCRHLHPPRRRRAARRDSEAG